MGYKTAANERSRRITLVRRIQEARNAAQGLKIEADRQGLTIEGLDLFLKGLERDDWRARIDPID